MLVNKGSILFDTYDGLFNYLWDSNNNNPFDRTAQHSLGILLGSDAAQEMKRRRWIGFPRQNNTWSVISRVMGWVIEFRAESWKLVNLKKQQDCTPYGVLYHWHGQRSPNY